MATLFGKGIGVNAGFDLGSGSPLDSRYVVDTKADLDEHAKGNRIYAGMLVYVKDEDIVYKYSGKEWVAFGKAETTTVTLTGDATASFKTGEAAEVSTAITLNNVHKQGGTGTKVTYNEKGLVTGVEALTAEDIPELDHTKITGLGSAATMVAGSGKGNVLVVGDDGFIDASVIPKIAISEVLTANTKEDLINFTNAQAQKGDICILTGGSKETYILTTNTPSVPGSWKRLESPLDGIQKINEKEGSIVTLVTDDIAEGPASVNQWYTEERAKASFDANFKLANSTDLADTTSLVRNGDTVSATNISETEEKAFVTTAQKTAWDKIGTDLEAEKPKITANDTAIKAIGGKNIGVTGDVTGTSSAIGTTDGNISIELALGEQAGITIAPDAQDVEYKKVKVNKKGIVVGGSTELTVEDLPAEIPADRITGLGTAGEDITKLQNAKFEIIGNDVTAPEVAFIDGPDVKKATLTAELKNVGTADTYVKVTTDAKGRVVSGEKAIAISEVTGLQGEIDKITNLEKSQIAVSGAIVATPATIQPNGTATLDVTEVKAEKLSGTIDKARFAKSNEIGDAVLYSEIGKISKDIISGLGTVATKNFGIESGNVPVLGADGKLDENILPKLAITDTFVVGSESEMLGVKAEVGDVAVRNDLKKSFILQTADPKIPGHWVELQSPTDAVQSVNGEKGAVVLSTDKINEGSKNLYYTEERFTASLAGKSTDDVKQGTTNKYFTDELAKTAAKTLNVTDLQGQIPANRIETSNDAKFVAQTDIDNWNGKTTDAKVAENHYTKDEINTKITELKASLIERVDFVGNPEGAEKKLEGVTGFPVSGVFKEEADGSSLIVCDIKHNKATNEISVIGATGNCYIFVQRVGAVPPKK